MLLDTHFHLDFVAPEQREDLLGELAARGVQVVAQTLLPTSHSPAPLTSLGFHPWWIESKEQADRELECFRCALPHTRFVGEVGLDFSPRRLEQASADLQRAVLGQILEAVRVLETVRDSSAQGGEPHVMSIHAVRAATELLDLWEEVDMPATTAVPVFHWFSGTSDDLTRLIKIGGYISVNPRMLESKRGRAYVRQVPADRLLLETDLPAQPLAVADIPDLADQVAGLLVDAVSSISLLRGEDAMPILEANQARLYGL